MTILLRVVHSLTRDLHSIAAEKVAEGHAKLLVNDLRSIRGVRVDELSQFTQCEVLLTDNVGVAQRLLDTIDESLSLLIVQVTFAVSFTQINVSSM